MPIPKLSKGQYPPEWRTGKIQRHVKLLAGNRCESCGMEFHPNSNWAVYHVDASGKPVQASVHHLDFDKSNCEYSNLVYLCSFCHLDCHRWSWKPGDELPTAWRNKLPAFIVERGLPYQTKQLTLWSEEK